MIEEFKYSPNWELVAQGLGLDIERTKRLFNDGRVIGRLSEFVIEENGIGDRTGNENSPYDNLTKDNLRLEVRALGPKQMSFLPSKEIGYGRIPTEEGFRTKLDNLDLYIAADYLDLNEIKFIPIKKSQVEEMHSSNILTKNKSVNRTKLLNFLKKDTSNPPQLENI